MNTHQITWFASNIEGKVIGNFDSCCRLYLILRNTEGVIEVTQGRNKETIPSRTGPQ